MKTNVISNFRDYATVTHPIEADDLKTPKVYQYSPARYIVTDYNQEQRADLLEMTHGRETADGIVFAASKWVRDRLHSWQNYEAHKQRAAILGDGWQYISGLRHGTQPGDVVCCVDGTQGRVTKSDPESCCIEFETADGRRLSVAGYFRKERQKAAPSSWATDYSADDFRKLTSRYEVADEDRDIIGQRFELTAAEGLARLQIFVSDYAGNEAHALYYIWDEWANEVRANVRPLSYLRDMLTTAKGWHPLAA